MTRALDPEVVEVIWATIEPILPVADDSHPLGCHNPRVPDRLCFRGLIRLVTGSSWKTSKPSSISRCLTPRCGPDLEAGW